MIRIIYIMVFFGAQKPIKAETDPRVACQSPGINYTAYGIHEPLYYWAYKHHMEKYDILMGATSKIGNSMYLVWKMLEKRSIFFTIY